MSISFSSTIFLTAGDKFPFVFGGTYFFSFTSIGTSLAKVSKIKAPLLLSSEASLARVNASCFIGLIFFFLLIVPFVIFFSVDFFGGL